MSCWTQTDFEVYICMVRRVRWRKKKKMASRGRGGDQGCRVWASRYGSGFLEWYIFIWGKGLGSARSLDCFLRPCWHSCAHRHTHKRNGSSPWRITVKGHQSWILAPIDLPSAQSVIETYRLRISHHPYPLHRHRSSESQCRLFTGSVWLLIPPHWWELFHISSSPAHNP